MIEWVVTSSALILLVLLLRAVIKNRVSPRLRYALWALVLLRLLIPGTLWESRASVMTPIAAQEVKQEAVPGNLPVFTSPFAPDSNPYLDSVKAEVIDPTAMGQSLLDPALYTLPEKEETVDWKTYLTGVWLTGVAAVGAFLVVVNLKFALNLKKKRQSAGKYRGRPVYTADALSTPCLFGLLCPAIYLTQDLMEDEKPHVLAHEYAHFRQRDHIWAALRGVCLAAHWYNPLVWLAAVLSRRDCELSCDEGAVRLLGEEHRADYGRTLVGLVARRTTPKDLACCATTLTGGKSALKERITLLVKRPRTTAVMATLIAAACVVFAVCTFTGAAEAEEPDAPAEPVQTEQEDNAEPEPAGLPEDVVLLPLPDDLPTEFMDMSRPAEEQGEWLLLAQWPEADIALYRTNSDDGKVYLRYGEEFQMFEQDLSRLDMLPEMEKIEHGEGWGVGVWYKRHEGTYFNGESYEPGVVAEYVAYGREDGYWSENHFGSTGRLEPDLPALEELPTEIKWDFPGAYMDPILLLAELPEEDIALYYDQQSFYPGTLIRYGDHLQRVWETLGKGYYQPELYFNDMDGDGEKELAVTYIVGLGTGALQVALTVYEWDGENWTGHPANLEQGIIEDFNAYHTLDIYPEEGHAVVGYNDSEIAVDMAARFGNRSLWAGEGTVCELREEMYSYSMESYGLTLKIGGEIRPEGYPPATCYAFDYICNVYYEEDGTFRTTWNDLDTDYRWYPTADVSRLTPTFRTILREFIDECRWVLGGGDVDITENYFAICDVNGDGKDELITELNNTAMAGQVERVYDADGNELLAEYPLTTYYDNGYVTAGWSHNQGKAGDRLWPYDLYKYDAEAGKYVRIATVDGWDESLGEGSYKSYDGPEIPYPYDIDQDGDGFVYYIIEEEGGYAPVYGTPVDYDDYAQWAAQYLSGNVVDVHYAPLTEENIALIQ